MVGPFTKHPRRETGETWFQHFRFAVGVGLRMIITGIIFVAHGILPAIKIPAWLNLQETQKYLEKENEDRENHKREH